MRASFRHSNQLFCGCIDPSGFEPSFLTVIEGTSGLVPETLFTMCALAVCRGQDVIVVDGGNSFYSYAVSKAVKFMGFEPRQALSRIHVARGFTEYQNLVTVVTSFGGIWWGDRRRSREC